MRKRIFLSFYLVLILGLTIIFGSWCVINLNNKINNEPDLIYIQGGAFKIGSANGEVNEKPVHTVILSDFYIGKYEVTNIQFCEFLNEKGNQKENGVEWINLAGTWDEPSQKCNIYLDSNIYKVEQYYENFPVSFVSWYGANAYCKWLSEKTARKYRLPTEAEWEFVARNRGENINFVWGNDPPLGKLPGNFADETLKKIYPEMKIAKSYNDSYAFLAPVGIFEPNALGIYDLTGNVWEWCNDWFDHKYTDDDDVKNPLGPETGNLKVTRGGSWLDGPGNLTTTRRVGIEPNARSLNLGFRIAMEI